MKYDTSFVLLWVALIAVYAANIADGRRILLQGGKIIGGRDAVAGEFPYQVSLQAKYDFINGSRHICGGAIIDDHHILTAGHCIYGRRERSLLVVGGVLNISDVEDPSRVTIDIEKIYLHEEYDDSFLVNDIALLRMAKRFPLDSDVISAIPLNDYHLTVATICTASGWGYKSVQSTTYADILQALDMPLISTKVCAENYKNYPYEQVEAGMICAGYLQGGKDACDGDSGGPLECKGKLTGLVSWGNECAKPNYPSVFVDILYYKDWIHSTLNTSYADGSLLKLYFWND